MYQPAHFAESRVEVLHEFIREHPLAVFVTFGANELNANHIPFELDPEPAPFGTLRGHVARANPVWRTFSQDVEALLVFQGPRHYITPSWYPTKKEHGKVVPTYNYIVVHAYGPLRVIDDKTWLRGLVGRLTHKHESTRGEPWQITDAPDDYIEKMLAAIFEVQAPGVERIENACGGLDPGGEARKFGPGKRGDVEARCAGDHVPGSFLPRHHRSRASRLSQAFVKARAMSSMSSLVPSRSRCSIQASWDDLRRANFR